MTMEQIKKDVVVVGGGPGGMNRLSGWAAGKRTAVFGFLGY